MPLSAEPFCDHVRLFVALFSRADLSGGPNNSTHKGGLDPTAERHLGSGPQDFFYLIFFWLLLCVLCWVVVFFLCAGQLLDLNFKFSFKFLSNAGSRKLGVAN